MGQGDQHGPGCGDGGGLQRYKKRRLEKKDVYICVECWKEGELCGTGGGDDYRADDVLSQMVEAQNRQQLCWADFEYRESDVTGQRCEKGIGGVSGHRNGEGGQ